MFYLTGAFSKKIFYSKCNVMLIMLSTIIMYFIQLYDNSHLHFFAIFAILQYVIVTKTVSQTPLKNSLTAVAFTYILQCFLQLLVLYLILWINPDFDMIHSLPSLLFIMVITLLLTIIILHLVPIPSLYEKALKIPNFVILSFSFFDAYCNFNAFFRRCIYAPISYFLFLHHLYISSSHFCNILCSAYTKKGADCSLL